MKPNRICAILLMTCVILSNCLPVLAACYSPEEELLMAKGISTLKAEKDALTIERDAYKKAYESEVAINEEYATVLKDIVSKYDLKIEKYERIITTLEEDNKILKKENKQLIAENDFWKLMGIILFGAGLAINN